MLKYLVPYNQIKKRKEQCKQSNKTTDIPMVNLRPFVEGSQRYSIRKSTASGWARTFDKYSPSKEIDQSPIKASQANLKDKTNNEHLDMYVWTLSMSEQHFYDNAFLLLSYSKNDQKKMSSILHLGFVGVDMTYLNNLDEVTLLEKGTFGSVYSCRDPKTKQTIAVKHVAGKYREFSDHVQTMLTYMAERNASIRAMDSPFIVKLFSSLQIRATGDSFLFLEYCVGDLQVFINKIKFDEPHFISESLSENKIHLVQMLYTRNEEFIEIGFIYIFELLCGVDFLVKCNIIHQDIKPKNVMISSNFHLKIGDFGLAYRTRTIHRETNTRLVNVLRIEESEKENYYTQIAGTYPYQDFETHLMLLSMDDPEALRYILQNKKLFNTPSMSYKKKILHPCFLLDTWAVGVIAVMLLFRGFMISDPDHLSDKFFTIPKIPKDNVSILLAHIIGRENIYTRYIRDGLIKSAAEENEELMGFIASIFMPRLARCKLFTKEKEIYHYSQKIKMKYVDMDKVEQLKTFADRKFNSSSIHLHHMTEDLGQFFIKKVAREPKTFEQLLKEMSHIPPNDSSNKKTFTLEPGLTINFFG